MRGTRVVDRPLTHRQRQVVLLIAQGHSNKEIAAQLHLSEGTIKVYVNHIFQKLKKGSRLEVAVAPENAAALHSTDE